MTTFIVFLLLSKHATNTPVGAARVVPIEVSLWACWRRWEVPPPAEGGGGCEGVGCLQLPPLGNDAAPPPTTGTRIAIQPSEHSRAPLLNGGHQICPRPDHFLQGDEDSVVYYAFCTDSR